MTGEVQLRRTIAWLRGDPQSIEVIRKLKELLSLQGIDVILPSLDKRLSVDVAVLPKPDSPESRTRWQIYAKYIIDYVNDPWQALSLAIVAPKKTFRTLSIGIDPGPSFLGLSAIADNVLLWISKLSLRELKKEITWLKNWIPSLITKIYVGGGEYSKNVTKELNDLKYDIKIINEDGTTSMPSNWCILEAIRDRDLMASITIALIGLSKFI